MHDVRGPHGSRVTARFFRKNLARSKSTQNSPEWLMLFQKGKIWRKLIYQEKFRFGPNWPKLIF